MVTTKIENSAVQLAAAANIRKIWADVIFNVKAYGAKGDGSDATLAINQALAAIKSNGGGELYFPPGVYTTSSKIQVFQGDSINIVIRGAGKWATIIKRSPSYLVGDIFSLDVADGQGASALIEGMRIENAPYTTQYLNNSDGYAIHIKGVASNPVIIQDVWVENGNGGIWIDNSSVVTIDKFFYQQIGTYAALYPSFAGIYVTGSSNTNFISNSDCFGQDVDAANNLSYGILIRGADGIQISNCAMNGKKGLAIEGSFGSNVDDVYLSNCVIDNVSSVGVSIAGVNAPKVFDSIRLANCHINVGNHVGAQDCIQIGGDVDDIQIIGCNVGLGTGGGINISGASWRGGGKRAILIEGNMIMDNNLSNTANTQGINIGTGVTGVMVIGNKVRNASAAGHQKYGVVVGDNCSNIIVTNNDLSNNETGPLFLGSGLTNVVVKDNLGVDNVSVDVASANTITLTPNNIVTITGTTAINTINGGWHGREITLIPTTGSVILGTGGNILAGKTMPIYSATRLIYLNTSWFIQ